MRTRQTIPRYEDRDAPPAAAGALADHSVLKFIGVGVGAPRNVCSFERKSTRLASASLPAVVGKPEVRIFLGKDLKF